MAEFGRSESSNPDYWRQEAARLQAENAELREALGKIEGQTLDAQTLRIARAVLNRGEV